MRTESFDKWIDKPCFSNGTDESAWYARNCDVCVKSVKDHYDDELVSWRCQIQFQQQAQSAGINEGKVPRRTYEICQMRDCPYRKTERAKRGKLSKKASTEMGVLFDDV